MKKNIILKIFDNYFKKIIKINHLFFQKTKKKIKQKKFKKNPKCYCNDGFFYKIGIPVEGEDFTEIYLMCICGEGYYIEPSKKIKKERRKREEEKWKK